MKPGIEYKWKRYYGSSGGYCGATFHLEVDGEDTGWFIQHCGHPTANYPYLIYDPSGKRFLDPQTKRAFRHLRVAKDHLINLRLVSLQVFGEPDQGEDVLGLERNQHEQR